MDLLDRVVAGVSCRDVLNRLGDFLDGDLPDLERDQVQQHLAGCDNCARFGGHVGDLVSRLRALREPTLPGVPPDFVQRLAQRMASGE